MALALQMDETGCAMRDNGTAAQASLWHSMAQEGLSPSLAREWDMLAAQGVASPYQSRLWVEGFMAHAGQAGDEHVLITIRDGGGALTGLFPLVLRRGGLGRIASFIGDKHANYHMPLIAPALAASLDTPRSHRLLREMGGLLPDLDAFCFFNQPKTWNATPAPLACLAAWAGTQAAYGLDISEGGEAAMARAMSKHARKNLRNKRRKLEEMGRISLLQARTHTQIDMLSAAFAQQKAERFADLGISDPFAAPGMMKFLRDGAEGETPALVWHALMLDERPIAVFVGTVDAIRYSGMATSFIADPDIARYSPGEALLAELITAQAEAGRRMFDLGVGEARYKTSFCDLVEPVVETVMPMTARGYGVMAALQMKRMAKQAGIILQRRNPALARVARRLLRQGGGG
jgi:CelD/BcsL family acetyltransferase involved in cellulose biosynthesis